MKDTYYLAKPIPQVCEFGPRAYLTVEGKGAPESEDFVLAVGSLYKRAYTARKNAPEKFTVGKLEGLWWAPDNEDSPREEWNWKLMIQVPDNVPDTEVIDEGSVVQILHVGPFATEPATLAVMYAFMRENNLVHRGLHHEVYLSDFRRTAPDKLRTILRQPIRAR